MKRTLALTLIIGAAAGIAFADGMTDDATLKNLNNASQSISNQTGATGQTEVTSTTLTLSQQASRLIATTITNRATASNDDLQINWIAPRISGCSSSIFPIKAGPNRHHDVFWAYRTVIHTSGGKTYSCNGVWSVQVINVTTGKTLASQSYTVK